MSVPSVYSVIHTNDELFNGSYSCNKRISKYTFTHIAGVKMLSSNLAVCPFEYIQFTRDEVVTEVSRHYPHVQLAWSIQSCWCK